MILLNALLQFVQERLSAIFCFKFSNMLFPRLSGRRVFAFYMQKNCSKHLSYLKEVKEVVLICIFLLYSRTKTFPMILFYPKISDQLHE